MEAGASAGAAAGAGDDGRSGIEDTTAPSVLMEATAADRSRAHIRGTPDSISWRLYVVHMPKLVVPRAFGVASVLSLSVQGIYGS